MNRKSAKTIVWASLGPLVLVALVVTGARAESDPARASAPLAQVQVVSSTLSYQGQLLSDGSPVNGTRVMTFSVYAQASGGGPLWSQAIDVAINKGLFTGYLQGDPALFDGQALWLGGPVAGESGRTMVQQFGRAP